MSQTKLCRLCVKVCTDYASLYNETGQKNNICEITLKYFDPMFLNSDQVPGSVVLCLECCGHISVFYKFQLAVFQAQTRLREGEREIEFEFKKEMSEELISDNTNNSHLTVKQEDSISLPDLELAEEFMFADNLQNEDNQVTLQTVNEPIPQCENTEEKEDTEQSKDQPLSTYDTSQRTQNEFKKGMSEELILENMNTSHVTVKQDDSISLPDLELAEEYMFADNFKNEVNQVNSQTVVEPIPQCENTEEKEDTEQSEDRPISTSDTPESEMDNDSDDNQPTTTIKRKLRWTQSSSSKDVDAVIAQWKPRLECVVCKKSLRNFKSLSDHFRIEHPNERRRVECCSRKIYWRSRLVAHARLHLNPDKVKCKHCDSYFASINWMHSHMRVVHFTTNIEISDTIGNFKLRSKSSIECVLCQTPCAKFSVLREHYRLEHPTEVCYALCCERKFNRAYDFEEHMQVHSDPNAFKCKICGKSLFRSQAFRQHMRLHRDPNAFKCEICGKKMGSPQALRPHMRRCQSVIKTAAP